MSGLLVGADVLGGPHLPGLPLARHCEPATDVTGVAIRIFKPPLKGHCEARNL